MFNNLHSILFTLVMVGLFDRFTKKDEEDYGGEMVEEEPSESYEPESMETATEPEPESMETATEPEPEPHMTQTSSFESQPQTTSIFLNRVLPMRYNHFLVH